MTDAILVLNAGSSSLKFALYEIAAGHDLTRMLDGEIEGIGTAPHLAAHDAAGQEVMAQRWSDSSLSHEALLAELLSRIEGRLGPDRLIAVGHRVVHGGAEFAAPVVIDDAVLRRLDALAPLAPLHQPHNLAAIRAVATARPGLRQVAAFDTAFHRTMPAVAQRFALPRALEASGIRRYGFHGLSFEYIAGWLRENAPEQRRAIVAHLGNGASLCALAEGISIDTTMSFTPLDGLAMGTRCGALDPGVVLFLLGQGNSADDITDLLYHRSGLLGVSGVSGDMRDLLHSGAPAAKEAIELFVFRCAREAGAMAASLDGLDAFVFTAGIGQNAPSVRAAIAARLGWLGVGLDETANARGETRISRADSAVAVFVVPTDEEITIARHTLAAVS